MPTAAVPAVTATPIPSGPVIPQDARYGGVLNLASRENVAHLDVHQEVSPALSTWGPGIAYSRLLRLKSGPNVALPSMAVECELCERWVMEDERTFAFALRKDAMWQDIAPVDGRALEAADIVFSYERQRQEGWPNAPLLQVIQGVEAPERDVVRVSLAFPDADFMLSLADGHSKIVAREAVELNGDLKNGPTIGSGPWTLIETRRDGAHTFVKNPDYFEKGFPFVERLNLNIIPDPATRAAAFRVRAIDVDQVEPQEWEELRRQRPEMQFVMTREAGSGLEVALKTSAPPFDDVRLRRAAFLAMDPWKANQEVWLGAAYVSLGFPTAQADWLLPDDELKGYFNDAPAARELLKQAGVRRPAVAIKVGDFEDAYLSHGRRIADEMRAVGFEPTIEVVNRRQFGEQVWLGGDYQMFVGPIAPLTSPNSYFLTVLHSQGKWNTTEFRDGELDALLEEQAQELDALARRGLALEIQRRVFANAYRFMPATRISIWAWWPRVQGFHPNFAASEYAHWSRVWVRD